jgi:hypothetical protein
MKFTIGGESHEIKMASWQRSNVSPSMKLTVERTMTDIEQKALALANEVRRERGFSPLPNIYRTNYEIEALCRAIEQHEAFRQEVSDVMTYIKALYPTLPRNFNRFIIIPAPKPDPLVEIMKDLDWSDKYAHPIRAALEARGLEIRSKK